MGQKDPGAIENPLHLEPAYLVAYEDIAAYQTALHIDPIVVLGCRSSVRTWPTSVKYHLLFKLVQVALHGKLFCRLFSFDQTSDSSLPLRFVF